ncbi:MAG: DNA gyrase inhibitor YacG [Planctomycetota bacterium]
MDRRPCPICGRPVEVPANQTKTRASRASPDRAPGSVREGLFPFCSGRCRLIDLGRWLDGEYRIDGGASAGEREDPS